LFHFDILQSSQGAGQHLIRPTQFHEVVASPDLLLICV
jgi:hypothetical protein